MDRRDSYCGRGYPALWRVLVGKEHTEDAANVLAERVRQKPEPGFVVRLDEPASPLAGSPVSGSHHKIRSIYCRRAIRDVSIRTLGVLSASPQMR